MEAGPACPVAQCGAIQLDTLASVDLGLPVERQVIAELGTITWAINASVGRPPGTTCSGAWACTTAPEQRRQAYFGRRVTSTRNCAGITPSRSLTSSPILAISPQPHGHNVLSGSMTRSTRGRWAGK